MRSQLTKFHNQPLGLGLGSPGSSEGSPSLDTFDQGCCTYLEQDECQLEVLDDGRHPGVRHQPRLRQGTLAWNRNKGQI